MTNLIIGNIFSFLSALFIAVSVIKKSKKGLIGWQILDVVCCILSNIFLAAYAALTTNSVALIRNILAYKNANGKKTTIALTVLCVIAGLYANNRGIIGLLPIIASASYTVMMFTTKNEQQMRLALSSNLLLWLVHDFYVQAYSSAFTDAALSGWTVFQIIRNRAPLSMAGEKS